MRMQLRRSREIVAGADRHCNPAQAAAAASPLGDGSTARLSRVTRLGEAPIARGFDLRGGPVRWTGMWRCTFLLGGREWRLCLLLQCSFLSSFEEWDWGEIGSCRGSLFGLGWILLYFISLTYCCGKYLHQFCS